MPGGSVIPYTKGELVEDAGVLILRVLTIGERQRDCSYHVAFPCCGREVRRTHVQIRKRELDLKRKRERAAPGEHVEAILCDVCRKRAFGARRKERAIEERKNPAPRPSEPLKVPLPCWAVPASVSIKGKSI